MKYLGYIKDETVNRRSKNETENFNTATNS